MIVIGVDVHKRTVTAVAVDEAGRMLDERTVAVGSEELIGWAGALGAERLWALEDCRLLTPWLQRQLLGLGEELVRVSPKLTVPERRAGRTRGKSDPIDALAVARAALREPDLPRPQPAEQVHCEIKLLVDHRDGLVDERRRTQQRLRWHLHELDPTLVVPLRRLDRASHLERVSRWLAPREQEVQVRIARELVIRCRSLTRAIDELNQELEQRTAAVAPALLELPGCGSVTAAKLLAEIGPISRFKSDAQLARHSRVAPLEASSRRLQRHRLDRGGNRQLNAALYRIAITQSRYAPEPSIASRSVGTGACWLPAAADKTICLWDVRTHRQLAAALRGHSDFVKSVAFSPDGRILASGSDDDTVRLWDVRSHRQLGVLVARETPLTCRLRAIPLAA